MSRLPDIQADLQHYVTRGGGAARAHIVGTDSASADERLDVYFQAYRLRLIEVLEIDFAGLRSLVNEAEFTDLAVGYIDAHPSVHPSVRWFGELLPEFLITQAPWRDQPVLGEMAQLEWLRGRAFDAADRTPLTSEELAAVPAEQWPGLHLDFHPSAQQLMLQWNVPMIWQSVSNDAQPPPAKCQSEPIPWAIWQQELVVYWRSLDPAEDYAMSEFRAGEDFASVCNGLCQWHAETDVPAVAAQLLRQWVGDGLITGFTPA